MRTISEKTKRIVALAMAFFITFSYMPGMNLLAEAATEDHDHTLSITKIEEPDIKHPFAVEGDVNFDGIQPMTWTESEVTNDLTAGAAVYAPTNIGEDCPYSYSVYGMEISGVEKFSFDYMTSCEEGVTDEDGLETTKDGLVVMVDDHIAFEANGETPWTNKLIEGLDAHSSYSLYFIYAKDGEGTSGADAAYVSNILLNDTQTAFSFEEADAETEDAVVEEEAAEEPKDEPVMLATDDGTATVSETDTSEGAIAAVTTADGANPRYFTTLGEAFAAVENNTDVITLLADEYHMQSEANENNKTIILQKGNFIIPSGHTLTIPFNDGSGDSAAMDADGTTSDTKIVAWKDTSKKYLNRKIVVAEGARIEVNGNFVVAGVFGPRNQNSIQGLTCGSYGELENNGEVNIYSGGVMRVYGLASGNGAIFAYSGATLYEPYLVVDFPGGTITGTIYSSYFPFLQYALINIQCSTEIHGGASVYGTAKVSTNDTINRTDIPMIGSSSSGLIRMNENSVATVTYDETSNISYSDCGYTARENIGRKIIHVSGGAKVGNLSISLKVSFLPITVSSSGKFIPIPPYFDITLANGEYELDGVNAKILPGATIRVAGDDPKTEINDKATLELSNESKLYVYNGMYTSTLGGKRYPTSNELHKSNLSESGTFVVDGDFIIGESGTFGGIIQSSGTGKVIAENDATVLNANSEVTEGGRVGFLSKKGIETKFYLPAQLWNGYQFINMVANKTYEAYSGENEAVKTTTITDYSCISWTSESGTKTTVSGGTIAYNSPETKIGAWNVYDILPSEGFDIVPAREGTNLNPSPEGNSFSFTIQVKEGYELPEGYTVKVNGNDPDYDKETDIYTIENITKTQVITIVDGNGESAVVDLEPVMDSAIGTFGANSEELKNGNGYIATGTSAAVKDGKITVTATDTGSGIKAISFAESPTQIEESGYANLSFGNPAFATTERGQTTATAELILDTTSDDYNQYIYVKIEDHNGSTIVPLNQIIVDNYGPKINVAFEESPVKTALNNLTGGLFFHNTVYVTITVEDNGTGVKAFSYALENCEDINAVQKWTEVKDENTVTVSMNRDNKFVVHVKAEDNSGHQTTSSTETAYIDNAAPAIAFSYVKNDSAESYDLESKIIQAEQIALTISAQDQNTDIASGTAKIEYVESTVALTEAELESATWTETSGDKVTIDLSNEIKFIYARATDRAGNSSAIYQTGEICVDNTAPTVTLMDENDASLGDKAIAYYKVASKTIKVFTIDALSGVQATEYLVSDEALDDAALKKASNWTTYEDAGIVINENDTRYNNQIIYIKVTDNAGNVTYVSAPRIVVDKTAPTLGIKVGDITQWNGEATYFSGETLNVEISAHDTYGIAKTQYYLTEDNSRRAENIADELWSDYTELNLTADKNTYVYAKVIDNAGNETFAETNKIVLDNTNPTGTITAVDPAQNAYAGPTNKDLTVTFSITEDNLQFAAYATETEIRATLGLAEDVEITESHVEDLENSAWMTSITSGFTIDTDFNDRYWMKLVDKSGNTTYVHSDNFILDKSVPIDLNILAAGVNGDATPSAEDWEQIVVDGVAEPHLFNQENLYLKLSAADGKIGSGVDKIEYVISGAVLDAEGLANATWTEFNEAAPVKLTESQILYVYARAIDKAGNVAPFSSDRVDFDHTTPEVTVTAGAYYKNEPTDYVVTKTDNITAGDKLQVMYFVGDAGLTEEQLANQNWEADPNFVEFVENEKQTLYVKVTDECGNVAFANTDPIIFDTNVPTGTIKVDNHEWKTLLNQLTFGIFFKETKKVEVIADTDLSGIASTEYYIDNTLLDEAQLAVKEWNPVNETSFDIAPNQKAVVYIKLTDNAGNVSYLSSNGMVLDVVEPTVTITGGKIWNGEDFYTDKAETLTVTAADNLADLKSIHYYISAEKITNLEDAYADKADDWIEITSGTEIQLNVDQDVIVYARAEDNAGNVSYAYTDRIVVDLTDPTGSIKFEDKAWNAFSDVIPHDIYKNTNITVQVEATDTNLDEVAYFISTSKDAYTVEQLEKQNWTEVTDAQVEVQIPETADQELRIAYVRITDKAGHVKYLSSGGFVLDNVAPEIKMLKEMDSNADNYGTASFTVEVSDTNFATVTLNGEEAEKTFAIEPLLFQIEDGKVGYTIVVTDKARNVTTKEFNYYMPLKVDFVDEDGTVIATKSDYHYGDEVEVPDNPTKASTATKEYAFTGWIDSNGVTYNKDTIPEVSGDRTYTATYKVSAYKVNFASAVEGTDDFVDVESQYVPVGETITFQVTKPTDDVEYCHVAVTADKGTLTRENEYIFDDVVTYKLKVSEPIHVTTSIVNHVGERVTILEAKCVTDGFWQRECGLCHDVRTEAIPQTGHHKAENATGVVTSSTCTEEGYTTYPCRDCEDTFRDDYTDPLGHDFEQSFAEGEGEVVRAATCTVPGIEAGVCSRCDETTTQDIPATGHSWGEAVRVIDPTCTTKGLDVKTCQNDGCGDTMSVILEATGHTEVSHDAKQPTCTEVGWNAYVTCEICDFTTYEEIAAKGHKYTSVVTAPKCMEEGYTTYTCSCGDSYVADKTPARGHTFGNWSTNTPATCTTAGERQHKCLSSDCGYVEKEVVEATGHHHVAGAITVPTCTTEGYTTYNCSQCTDSYQGDIVPATGHKYKGVVTKPTCETDGYTTYTCATCQDTYTDDVSAMTGHRYEATVVPPTCTEPGYTSHKCINCLDTYTDTETDPLQHNYEAVVTAPTCETGGYTTHTCANCQDVYVDTYTDATGHKWDESNIKIINKETCTAYGVYSHTCQACSKSELYIAEKLGHLYEDIKVEPTCEAGGYTRHDCQRCDVYYDSDGIPSKGHISVVDEAVAPTCTETGLTEGSHCGRAECGVTLIPQEIVKAKNHNFGQWTQSLAPTCTEPGSEYRECQNGDCDETETGTIEPLGHNPILHDGQEPSCQEDGWKPYETCGRCEYTTYENIPAPGHTPVADEAVAPTCTETGLTEGSHCDVCDTTIIEQDVIPENGHTPVTDEAVEPTCTDTGLTEGSHCETCGETLVAQKVVDALGHDWESENADRNVIVEPTCEGKGLELVTCGRTDCDATKSFAMDKLGHKEVVDFAKEPTCTETGLTQGSHCSVCNEVLTEQQIIDALGHEYIENWKTTTPPSCTEDGQQTRSCNRCDYVDTKAVEATGHNFQDDWTTTVTPTCTEDGEESRSCHNAACKETETRKVEATGHTEVIDTAVEPTCTAAGLTEGKHCSVCDTVLTEQKVVDANGHTMGNWEVTTDPTCTEDGEETRECTAENCDYAETQDIKSTGHTPVIDPAVEPTCTEKGWKEGSHCDVCGDTIVAQKEINPLGHDEVEHAHKDATCTEDGHTAYETCNRCDYATEYEVLPATGHDWDAEDGLVISTPTCTLAGLRISTCQTCQVTKMHTDPATGHDYSASVVPPTCTEDGYKLFDCDNCGDSYTEPGENKNGHVWGEDAEYGWFVSKEAKCEVKGEESRTCADCGITETREIAAESHSYTDTIVDPTCTTDGYTLHTCGKCGDSYQSDVQTAAGHTEVIDPAEAPTCTADGKTEGKHCSVCGEILVAQLVVKGEGHDYKGEVTPPTCTEDGYTTLTCQREGCGHSYTDYISKASGHKYKETVVEPTCTTAGHTLHVCAVCDDSYTDNEKPATGHKYEATVIAPICTEGGYTQHQCKNCDDNYVTDRKNATGHSWGDWDIITDATCLAAGFKNHICQTCETAEMEIIPAKGHDYDAAVVPATCTEDGYTIFQCKDCIDSYRDNTVTATGHDLFEHGGKAPTCTKAGWEAYETCAECDYTTFVEVPALDHDYEDVVTEPTCTEEGYTTYTCGECGDSYVDDVTEAAGHTMTGWTVTEEPACEKAGEEQRGCEYCDLTESRAMDALEHQIVTDPGTDATCTAEGLTEGSHCERCGNVLSEQVVIPKLTHDYKAVVTASTCTEDGYTTYTCKDCGKTYVSERVDAKDHSYAEWQMILRPTCTEEGTQRRDCTACHHYETEPMDALDHDLKHTEAVDSTCTAEGHKAYDACTRCNYTTYEAIPKKNHNLSDVVTVIAPDCLEKGWGQQTCADCEFGTLVEIPSLGHDTTQHAGKDATCTEGGCKPYETCGRCGYSTYEETDALGHAEITVEGKEPTCTETGLTDGLACGRCDAVFTEQEEIPAEGHNHIAVETKPTCTEDGFFVHTCDACGDSYQTEGEGATGHTYTGQVTKEATTERNGETTYTCEDCQDAYTRLIPATVSGWMSDADTNSVTIQWKQIATEEGYALQYEIWTKNADGTFELKQTVGGDQNQFRLAGLDSAEVQFIKVRAVMNFGEEVIYGSDSKEIIAATTIAKPLQLQVIKTTASTVELAWQSVEHAEGYEVYQTDAAGTYKIALVLTGEETSAVLTNLNPATAYGYKVRAFATVAGEKVYGDFSSAVQAETNLGAVTEITVDAVTLTTAEISWHAVTHAEGYEIYLAKKGADFQKYGETGDTAMVLTDLAPGAEYEVKVKAYKTKHDEKSYGAFSPLAVCSTGIGALSGLEASQITDTSAKVQWNAVDGAEGYDVYLAGPDGDFKLFEKTEGTTEVTLKNLKPVTGYQVQVKPYAVVQQKNVYGEGEVIAWVTEIAKMTGLQTTAVSDSTVNLTWNTMEGVDGYEIYMSADNGTSYSRKALISSASTAAESINYLDAGTKYLFKIRGYKYMDNGVKYGAFSDITEGITNLKKVTGLYVGYPTAESLKVSWSKAKGTDGYEVYLSTAKDGAYRLAKVLEGQDNCEIVLDELQQKTTYYVKVRAFAYIDETLVYGPFSNVGSRETKAAEVKEETPVVTPPAVEEPKQEEPAPEVPAPEEPKQETPTVADLAPVNDAVVQQAASNGLQIVWSPVDKAEGYHVYLKKTAEEEYKLAADVKSGNGAVAKLGDLESAAGYHIVVRAYINVNGQAVYGDKSVLMLGRTLPEKAKNIKLNSRTAAKQTISWKKVEGASGYQVFRTASKNGKYKLVKTVKNGNTTKASFSKLKSATTYYYIVRAYSVIDGVKVYGEKSKASSFITKPAAKAVKVKAKKKAVTVKWSKAPRAKGYQIYRATSKNGKYKLVKTVKNNKTFTYKDKKVKKGKTYYYKVRAYVSPAGKTKVYGKFSAVKKAKVK